MHTNALKRIVKCIPPPGFDAYQLTGATDQNGIGIWKPLMHTCGVESLNSAQPDFVSTHVSTKEYAAPRSFTPAHPCAPRVLSLLSQPLPAKSAP